MLKIHKEGFKPLFITLLVLATLNVALHYLVDIQLLNDVVLAISILIYLLVLQFFRNPQRHIKANPYAIIAPADGKVVVIDEVEEEEYFKDKRLQISIFMSPINVHVNRYPVGGLITYAKYHAGKFLVAWHPKSSTLNERTTVVVKGEKTGEILYRQIAGALARRIIMYAQKGQMVKQGSDSGFIRFGSRVDIFLPVGTTVLVQKEQKVIGGETVIATFEEA